jgi:hypothetical protein
MAYFILKTPSMICSIGSCCNLDDNKGVPVEKLIATPDYYRLVGSSCALASASWITYFVHCQPERPPLLRADTTPGSLRSVPMHGLHRQPNLPDEVNERGHQQNQGDAE